jgi:hypothetical protein
MPEPSELETLLGLMPPVTASDTDVDWDRMAQSWGRSFPLAYRRFIEVYGAGTIQANLTISRPEPKGPPGDDSGDMRADTALAEVLWAESRKAPDLSGATPRLITWGVDSSGDHLCWDTTDEDPERWPTLVFNRGDSLWRRYDGGMVEFIVRVLRADFPECPLGDLSLWGRKSALFLNRSEYARRLREGHDPWTGEPDPYAGMFGQ